MKASVLVHWKNWPAAVFRTSASLPAAKGATFAACTARRWWQHTSEVLAVLAVLWAAGVAVAQTPPPPGHGGPFQIDKLAVLLDLSDTQKTQVQAVLEEEHSEMKALFQQAKASGTKPTFEQMRATHEQLKQETIQKLTPILSSTQLQKFEILAEDHGPPRGAWHHGQGQSSSASSSN